MIPHFGCVGIHAGAEISKQDKGTFFTKVFDRDPLASRLCGDKHFVFGTYSATGYYAKAAEILNLIFLWLDKPNS